MTIVIEKNPNKPGNFIGFIENENGTRYVIFLTKRWTLGKLRIEYSRHPEKFRHMNSNSQVKTLKKIFRGA